MIDHWDAVPLSSKRAYRYLYKILRKEGTPTLNDGQPLTPEQARERINVGITFARQMRESRSRR